MAAVYLKELQGLLGRLAPESEVAIECKHFFSRAAAYADGHIFMTLTPAGLALKAPENLRDHLLTIGATPLQYFPNAPIKKEYVVVPATLREDEKALARWVGESLKFVLSG